MTTRTRLLDPAVGRAMSALSAAAKQGLGDPALAEIAALELTEAVTVLTDGFVPDEVYDNAARHFEEAELAQVIAAIAVINAWNRFGVTCRMAPGHYEPGQYK